MPLKQHGRRYDVVVFGATGYTGKLTAEHIATHLPSNLKWAVAGRSEAKLREVVAECETLNPDRVPPGQSADQWSEGNTHLTRRGCNSALASSIAGVP